MRIIGHGIDIVEVARIAEMLRDHGQRFEERCFTAGEREYAQDRKRAAEHLAGRFAAKEAVLKAMGTGLVGAMTWLDVEVIRDPSGRPSLQLHGRCGELARELGIDGWWLSISHADHYAVASVIATAPSPPGRGLG